MSNILKVRPEEIKETCSDLKRLSSEIQEIVNQFRLLSNKMQSQWEGGSQQAFDNSARYSIMQMEKFAHLCDDYSDDIQQMANYYLEAENSFASDINKNILPSTIIE